MALRGRYGQVSQRARCDEQPNAFSQLPGGHNNAVHDVAWQATSHAHAWLQSTAAQASIPPHATSQAPVLQATLLHEPWPLQPTLHEPAPQVTPVHARNPAQSTLQAPSPQVTSWQLRAPVQLTVQLVLPVQSTPRLHELAVEHRTSHAQPAGHATGRLHASGSISQSMVQPCWAASQDVHPAGQTNASTVGAPPSGGRLPALPVTQNPSMQARPVLHSDDAVHAKSTLRWLTEQLPATAAMSPSTASQIATSFIDFPDIMGWLRR